MRKDMKFLRMKDVCERVGLGRTTVWRLTKEGKFPASHLLGSRSIGWLESDVEKWMKNRPGGDSLRKNPDLETA